MESEIELGKTADFQYTPGDNILISNINISAGAVIVITYYPIVKGREIILNSSEISRINNQTGRKGTISRYENRNDATSSQELQKIGQTYIKYKGEAEIILTIESESNLFNVGQIVNYQAPIQELQKDYMVNEHGLVVESAYSSLEKKLDNYISTPDQKKKQEYMMNAFSEFLNNLKVR